MSQVDLASDSLENIENSQTIYFVLKNYCMMILYCRQAYEKLLFQLKITSFSSEFRRFEVVF